jgi:hypothetical protein
MKKFPIFNILVLILSISVGVLFALKRLVARDEGFYAYAAQLVSDGSVPYRDFFFPQMPLTAYFYGFGGLLFGSSWDVYRIISGLCFAGILWLVYLILLRNVGRAGALVGFVLTATCHLSFAWFPVIQTYGLSTLLLLAGVYLLMERERDPRARVWFGTMGSGLLFSLAVQTRLFFLPLCIIPILFLFGNGRDKKAPIRFFLGFIIGSLPLGALATLDVNSFSFSNLGYHLIRSDLTFQDSLNGKWRICEVLFSLGEPSQKFRGFQTPLLFGGMILGLFLLWRKLPMAGRLSGIIGLTLLVVSFVPTPTYVQYFVTVVPFAVIVTVMSIMIMLENSNRLRFFGIVSFLLFLGVTYERHLLSDIERYTVSGTGVIGIGNEQGAKEWNLTRVQYISSLVEQFTLPEDSILALWPGYLVGIDRKSIPGGENHFGRGAYVETLSTAEQVQYHLLSNVQLRAILSEGVVSVVIGHRVYLSPEIREVLRNYHYKLVAQVEEVEIFQRKKSADH